MFLWVNEDLSIKNICGQVKLLYQIIKGIGQDKRLLAMGFDRIRLGGLRIKELGMSPLPLDIDNAVLLKYPCYLS